MAGYPFPLSIPTLCITKKEYEVKKNFNRILILFLSIFPNALADILFFDIFFGNNMEKKLFLCESMGSTAISLGKIKSLSCFLSNWQL